MDKRSVAILGAGFLQKPFIEEAKRLGLGVIALDQSAAASGAASATTFLQVQIANPAAVIEALTPFKEKLAFVTTVATDFSHIVGLVNDAFSLPGLNAEQGRVLTHKGAMRDFCLNNKFAHPQYKYANNKTELLHWAEDNFCEDGFVIKPVQNMGARGVMFFEKPHDLEYAFEFAADNDKNGWVVLEHFIPAREISVDAISFEGKVFLTGVADRIIEIKDRHFFIETGHSLPAKISAEAIKSLQKTMQRFADCLGALAAKPYHGALKGDLRLTPSGEIVIGEIAGRLSGGFMSTHTFPAAHKKSLMELFARTMLFDQTVIAELESSHKSEGVAIERSLYGKPGILEGMPSEEERERLSHEFAAQGLLLIHTNYKNGDTIQTLQNNIGKVFHSVIHAETLEKAESVFADLREHLAFQSITPPYDPRAMAKVNRERWNNKFCWVCKVCDGVYCASSVPGMGGPGLMNSFKDNNVALAEYHITPVYTNTASVTNPDTTFELFRNPALRFAGPLLSAPITGSKTNMGGSITEYDYAIETGSAMLDLDLMPTFGDGASSDKYRIGLHAIEVLGRGMPVFKPRADQRVLIQRIQEAERAGAAAWGIDIDGVSFKTLSVKNVITTHKSLAELKELSAASSLPFFIKGVMTEADAQTAIDAGAQAIVVSNHGGRVADAMPGTARVLPRIAQFVKKRAPHVQVLADGGVRSGSDIFRMLALGAEAVLVGRPIAITVVGHGRAGVASMVNAWLEELKQTMRVCGVAALKDIDARYVSKFV